MHVNTKELPFRVRDVIIATIMLICFSPILILTAIAIRIDSPGPIIFRQKRVGRHGKTFQIHKFRSMSSSKSGLAVSTSNDPRITRVGRVIRTAKIDELPQLFDVLRGTMSMVGPRPEVPKYVAMWPEDLRPTILSVRPGITDPATVELRNEAEYLATQNDPERIYIEQLLPDKAAKYVDYVSSRTLVGDMKVVLNTIFAILRPTKVSKFLNP